MSPTATHPAIQQKLAEGKPVIIELGCGKAKEPGRIGLDLIPLEGVDIVANLEDGLPMVPDGVVDEIHSTSLLEHVENFELIMREMCRVLKPDGVCHVFVPHFSNPWYYSDFTHKRFFGLYTFYYFVDPSKQLRRIVPNYYTDIRIEILSLRLIFAYSHPFKFQKRWRKLYTALFNSSTFMQEFYESALTGGFPCYGIRLSFKKA